MHISDAVRALDGDLQSMFGRRLRSLVAYGDAGGTHESRAPTLVVVDSLTAGDLRMCAGKVASWHDLGLATPLVLGAHEFSGSLEAFPYEFGAILADHTVVSGENPFDGLHIGPADLRHACEIQARSHLLHLRQGYLETRGRGDAIADLVARSAPPFVALVKSVARLQGAPSLDKNAAAALVERAAGLQVGSLGEIVKLPSAASPSPEDARRLFPGYLAAIERLTSYIDSWTAS
jgi:hypothetical protein